MYSKLIIGFISIFVILDKDTLNKVIFDFYNFNIQPDIVDI